MREQHDPCQTNSAMQPGDDPVWAVWGRRWFLFWTAVLYLAITLCTFNAYGDDPSILRGWNGVGLFALLAVFLALYHVVLMQSYQSWPMRRWRAVLYFGGQTIVLALLSRYSLTYAGLAFAVLGHVTSTLRPRHWPLPMLVMTVLLGKLFGVDTALLSQNWLDLGWIVLNVVIYLAFFISVSLLVGQRFHLVAVVAELQRAKAQIEANAAQAEELAALRERARLARDMHDSIGHALVVVNVKLEAAQRLYRKDAVRGDAELESTRALVRDTMADLRRSLENLRAPLPDHQDLPYALERIAADLRDRTALDVRVAVAPGVPPLTGESAEVLWRVAREAVANVERHAAADSVRLSLERQSGSIVLRIADDGRGIAAGSLDRPGHYGIIGMRERLDALGGTLSVVHAARGGTVIEASLPLAIAAISQDYRSSRDDVAVGIGEGRA